VRRDVSAELLGLRTARATVRALALALAAGGALAVTFLGVRDVGTNTAADVRDALSNASVSGLVALLYGVVVAGGETRHRTLAGVLLLQPARARYVVAQAAAVAVCGAGFAVCALLLASIVVLAILAVGGAGVPLDFAAAGVVARAVAYGALCGAAGVGIGHATGSQAGGVLAALGVLLIVDPIFSDQLVAVARFGPVGASAAWLGGTAVEAPWWQGGLALAAYVVALVAAGCVLLGRRDVGT
jgi:ABC-2 type transport system permease protein